MLKAIARWRTSAAGEGFGLGVAQIRSVRARVPARCNGMPCVRELDERLRGVL